MTKPDEPTCCPECGAAVTAGETCTDRYHACLALEYTDGAYFGSVHHFTVLAYNLQHPSQLSADGWHAMRHLLHRFLSENISPARMRQLLQGKMAHKSFSMVKGAKLGTLNVVWHKTIMDVRLDSSENYCADIRAWAEAVHKDLGETAA